MVKYKIYLRRIILITILICCKNNKMHKMFGLCCPSNYAYIQNEDSHFESLLSDLNFRNDIITKYTNTEIEKGEINQDIHFYDLKYFSTTFKKSNNKFYKNSSNEDENICLSIAFKQKIKSRFKTSHKYIYSYQHNLKVKKFIDIYSKKCDKLLSLDILNLIYKYYIKILPKDMYVDTVKTIITQISDIDFQDLQINKIMENKNIDIWQNNLYMIFFIPVKKYKYEPNDKFYDLVFNINSKNKKKINKQFPNLFDNSLHFFYSQTYNMTKVDKFLSNFLVSYRYMLRINIDNVNYILNSYY